MTKLIRNVASIVMWVAQFLAIFMAIAALTFAILLLLQEIVANAPAGSMPGLEAWLQHLLRNMDVTFARCI